MKAIDETEPIFEEHEGEDPLAAAWREFEEQESLVSSLKRELSHLPTVKAEATAAADVERLRSLEFRGQVLQSEIIVNSLMLERRRLAVLELERDHLISEQHGLIDKMEEAAKVGREAQDLVNALLADYSNFQLEKAHVEVKLETNRTAQREARRMIGELVERAEEAI
jgi:serine phosphatase RsbU (regulator of sigma subunit)